MKVFCQGILEDLSGDKEMGEKSVTFVAVQRISSTVAISLSLSPSNVPDRGPTG